MFCCLLLSNDKIIEIILQIKIIQFIFWESVVLLIYSTLLSSQLSFLMVAGSRVLSLWRKHKLDWAWSDYKSSGNTWNALSQFCNSATLRLSICPPTSPEVTLVTNCTLKTCIFHILYIWHICNWCFAALWFMLSDGFLVITCLYLLPGVIHNMAEVPSILLGNRSMHGCSIWLFPGKRWSTPGRCEYSISSWWQ